MTAIEKDPPTRSRRILSSVHMAHPLPTLVTTTPPPFCLPESSPSRRRSPNTAVSLVEWVWTTNGTAVETWPSERKGAKRDVARREPLEVLAMASCPLLVLVLLPGLVAQR